MYISNLGGSDWNPARYFMIASNVRLPRNQRLQALGCFQPPIGEQCG